MKLNDVLGGGLKVLNPSGGCHNCPRGRKDFVPATLRDTQLLIVGEAPGATEVEEGEGFTGRSGRYLRSVLSKHGIDEYSLTNIIKCRPPSNRDPHAKEKSCCLNQYTVEEIRGYPVVLLTGKVPTETLFPGSKYSKMRGHVVYHPDFPGQRFYSVFHPAYISRRQDKGPEFERQIERLARILDEDPANPSWEIIRGDTSRSLEDLKSIMETQRVSFDIETNGLESWHPDKKMTSFAACSSEDAAVFFHESDPYWDEALDILGEGFADTGTVVIAHNAGFDLEWVERQYDMDIRCQIADTQSLYYLLYMAEDYRKARMASLKDLTADELDGYRYLIPNPDQCNDPNLLAKYNTEDIIRTLQLFKKGFPKLNDKQRDLFFRVSSPSSLACRRLTTTGLYLDLEYCQELAEDLRQERDEEIQAWMDEDPEFDPDEHMSGDGFLRYVYAIRDMPVIQRTEKDKKPSAAKDTIKELIRDHDADFLKHRLEIQRIEKQLSTYVEPYLSGENIDPYTERVHPDYLNTYTRTGRTSSRNPNGQNIPRASKIRRLFSAPEGQIFMESDYSQIELRIAMALSGDETGLEAYRQDGDLHARTAKILAKKAGRDEWTKEDRTNAKIINFSLIYGGDAGTVKRYAASTFGIQYSWDEAEKFHRTFFETYDKLPLWHQEVIDELRQNQGHLETVMGHPRFLRDYDSPDQGRREHFERVAINTTCQSPAGYITLYTLFLIQQRLKESGLWDEGVITTGSVHDSILYELPDASYIEPTINIVEPCVNEVKDWISPWFPIPLVMDYEVGSSWGDKEEIDITP